MINYYSQYGEDVLLNELFKTKESGFFVEIGCIDGRRFSNTLAFEEKGWSGLCIEAHSGYIDLLKKNRPSSIICHCAVGEKNEDNVPFFANSRGSLSTLDRSKESYFKENYGKHFTGFEEQWVKKRRLDTLFQKYQVSEIDFISLDIEGYEVEALKGLDFRRYKPTVWVIESDDPKHETQLDRILIPNGYIKSVKLGPNIFYLIDAKLQKHIEDKEFIANIIHTRHPLDNGEDKRVKIQINTKAGLLNKLLSKLKRSRKSR